MSYILTKMTDIIEFNPREFIAKKQVCKKVPMEYLQPFTRQISGYKEAPYAGGTKFRNNDTIMARITPCLENGKTALIKGFAENEVIFGSTEYIVMRAISGSSDPTFIYYLATSSSFREVAIKSMVGSSGRQRVQQDILENLELVLPDYETQVRVGKVLASLDDKIELNAQINHNLEEQAKAIFKSWFVDFEPFQDGTFVDSELGQIPAGWRTGVLSEIADITMGQSPKGSSYNENSEGSVFYQGRAEFTDRFPTRRLFTTEPKRMVEAGDVLLSVRAPVGDMNIANESCCIGRGLAAIHAKKDFSSFVFYTMQALKPELDKYNGEGTVFGCVNKDALNTQKVIIPPDNIISDFEKIASSLDQAYLVGFEENMRLAQLRDALLPKLMSGEIDVSEVEI